MNIHLSREMGCYESEKGERTDFATDEQTDTIDPLSSRDPFQFEMHFSQ